MAPTLHHGDIIVGWNSAPRVGDIVIAHHEDREIIKRCTAIKDGEYYLEGDNRRASTDSRVFGFVNQSAILGVMKLHFATATPAPKPRNATGQYVGWIAALIMMVFAVTHLFRIDTFVPELDGALPGGRVFATWAAVIIVVAEVFAVPFLLRMKLSKLARLKSAVFVLFVPVVWLLIAIWSYSGSYSTSQLGAFYTLPSSWFLIVIDAAWLAFNFYALYLLQPSWSKELRKR